MNLNFKKIFSIGLLFVSVLTVSAQKIALLADVHVTPGNECEGKLKEAVAEINSIDDYDIVVVAGDLTNEGSDEQLKNVKSILDKLEKPTFVIPGNHENNWSQSACKTFNDLWGADRFVTEVGDLVVVGINCGPYMKMGDGHIKQEDLIWLDETLSQPKYKGKRVISVNHYPISADLDNYEDYIEVLQKYKVIVHLCGHYHKFETYKGGDIDAMKSRSLDLKNGNFGYGIIEIVNDSIKQWNKCLNESPKLVDAIKIKDKIKPLQRKKIESSKLPKGVKVECVFKDVASIFTRVGFDENNLYFGNSLGYLKAINKKTGKLVWVYKTDASLFSRPAISEKYVVLPTADKRLVWLDKKDGKVVYQYYSNGPYVADGVVKDGILFQGTAKSFEAWDVDNMRPLWSTPTDNYCQAAPVVTDKDVTFGAWDTYLRNVDSKTGRVNWKWNNGIKANMLGPGNVVPIVTGDKVIVVAPDRKMTAIDRKSGKQLWRVKDKKVRESLGASVDGKVAYAKTMDGEVLAVSTEADEYTPMWCVNAGLGYEHAPCIVIEHKGVVYVGSRAGKMVAIDPVAQKVLWSAVLGSSEFNGWEIDEKGDLYTSLIEGTIWRISSK